MFLQTSMYGAAPDYLLWKKNRQERKPLEVLLAAMLATLAFGVCYIALCFDLRFKSYYTALLVGPGFFFFLCLCIAQLAQIRRRWGRSIRFLILAILGLVAGTLSGVALGERNWWLYNVYHFNYAEMGSYVNVDPGVDVGASFMDAATIYFKESSYVLSQKAVAFHNGATYCAAPIVRQPVQLVAGQANPNVLETVTGFATPRSGTIDFWAVGTDCCGKTGTDMPFTCGDGGSQVARSGMRVLDNNKRSMYLLAVQEWSASTGLPVKHPLFFTWVKDPVVENENFYKNACAWFWEGMLAVFIHSLIVFYCLQIVLFKFQVM